MEETFWICILLAAGWLFWLAHRSNRRHRQSRRARDLAQENEHLRHVVVRLAIERHVGR